MDRYRTIRTLAEGTYSEKRSKFLAFAMPVRSVEEVKQLVGEYQKKYYDARHVCYAYMLGAERKDFRANDNGEPSGTAGRPIHGQLLSKDLTNTLVIVVRYFGGIKLGVSGLINAYKTAAKDALDAATIIEKTVDETYKVSFDYSVMNSVMQLLKDPYVSILGQGYEDRYLISFKIRRREADRIVTALKKINTVTVE